MKETRTALIAAVALLLGAVIAGVSGIATTIENQKGENERMERRLEDEARGAARVLFSRLFGAVNATEEVLVEDRFMRGTGPYFIAPVSAADLKLITSRLSIEEFDQIDHALRATGAFLTLLHSKAGEKLTRDDRETVHSLGTEINDGRAALLGVAGLPTHPQRASWPPQGASRSVEPEN